MPTLRATLEPNGHVTLPSTVRHERPVTVLVTFLEEPAAALAPKAAPRPPWLCCDHLPFGRYQKAVVENLARDLQAEFPGRNGFSAQNLWLMRQFYREYHGLPKLQPLVREISWAKNLVILGRSKTRSNASSRRTPTYRHHHLP